MEHAREPVIRLFRDMVLLFGRSGTEFLICVFCLFVVVVLALLVYLGREFLQFGEATVTGAGRLALELFRVFRYQPRQASLAIRVELFLDSVLSVIAVVLWSECWDMQSSLG